VKRRTGLALLLATPVLASALRADAGPPTRQLDLCVDIVQPPALPTKADAGRKAWPVGADGQFLVVMKIASLKGDAPFASGSEQSFLIHSPTRTFIEPPRQGDHVCLVATVVGTGTSTTFVTLARR
jgi:hypothetical protein